MLQTPESHSNFHSETRKNPASQRNCRYLYLRGTIYYFRYAFSKDLRERLEHTEIRISLRTGFVYQAKKLATHLGAHLEYMLMAEEQKSYKEIRRELASKLEELLDSCPDKKPPVISDIKTRMDKLRQKYLDAADNLPGQASEWNPV